MFVAADALVTRELVSLGARPGNKEAAIRALGHLLVAAGCVDDGYPASMVGREAVADTFLGEHVAIPHGLVADRGLIRRDAIAVLQIPDGMLWNEGQTAKLVVAIAANSDRHIAILRRLTRLVQDPERLEALFTTVDPQAIIAALEEAPAAAAVGSSAPATDLAERFEWQVDYPSGLHARPASTWVATARAGRARVAVRHGEEVADARNLVALLGLGLRAGDRIVISTAGEDSVGALAAMRATLLGLSAGEKADAASAIASARESAVKAWNPPDAPRTITGIGASPGLAIGVVHRLNAATAPIPDTPVDLARGAALLRDALAETQRQLAVLVEETTRRFGAAEAAIFKAQGALLGDSDLLSRTCRHIVAGHGVAWSWNAAIEELAGQLAALGNAVLAGRAADLRDVGRRVIAVLDPSLAAASPGPAPRVPYIVVAADLSPSETAGLDIARTVGLATAQGGPTAHTAILARTLGLPALVAGGPGLLDVESGTTAIIDGQSGVLYLDPSEAALASARAWISALAEQRGLEAAERMKPARTRDGHTLDIGANVNLPEQVANAIEQGCEGVGLMRTEFLFLERERAPTEDEQFAIYRAMIDALGGRPLVVRALDIGGDKHVDYLGLAREDNSFLGVRGARLLLRRLDLLEPQLRALYRAAAGGGNLSLMFPMVTSLAEVLALRAHCERIRVEANAPVVPLGIMIEVPAAALLAGVLAEHVDFFSIGTNDLTQYALAIDRQNPELAPEADALHPAVLRLIAQTVAGAAKYGRWVGVCGGSAGDPFGAAILAGIGVTELSMTPREIAGVKARLRASDRSELVALAERALAAGTAAEVRALDGTRG